jgi:hypothetical protein
LFDQPQIDLHPHSQHWFESSQGSSWPVAPDRKLRTHLSALPTVIGP